MNKPYCSYWAGTEMYNFFKIFSELLHCYRRFMTLAFLDENFEAEVRWIKCAHLCQTVMLTVRFMLQLFQSYSEWILGAHRFDDKYL